MGSLSAGDILIIVIIVVGIIFALLFFLNKKASQKLDLQQDMISRSKQTVSIFIIDKKRTKITDVNMPKMVVEQMPKFYKFMKFYFVQAKIGPQIMTLMCDKKVFNALPIKKNAKVELAGIYIVNMIGMKSDKEIKEIKKAKKLKEKEENKDLK